MPEKALKKLAKQYHLGLDQLQELLGLLEAGHSPFYLLRYRKDLAGSLTAEALDELQEEERRLENLERDRRKVQKKLEEQGVLSEQLEQKISAAETMRELIDYYVPFRPRKRSRSRQALSQGLEPLARAVFGQEEPIALMCEAAAPYVDSEKGLSGVGDVLDGVSHIICDWIAEEKTHRDKQREVLWEEGVIVAWRHGKSIPSRLRSEFRQYLEFRTKVKDVHAYDILCLMRGRRLSVLTFRVEPPLGAMSMSAAELYMPGGAEQFNQMEVGFGTEEGIRAGEQFGDLNGAEFLYFSLKRSLSGILAPILSRELERELCREAERLALRMVRRNLRSLLMVGPLKGHRILAIWPGYRTGCKLAALDESGAVLDCCVVYPNAPQLQTDEAKARILELIQKHGLTVAAVGDWTAREETEELICQIISESSPEFRYAVVSDTGVTAYGTSQIAGKELPGISPELRAAVFVGRRLLDPLVELTKLNLRTLCPAQLVEEANSTALRRTIGRLVQQCVAEVGPELNTAPQSLLRHVPGLNDSLAEEVVKFRAERGSIASRASLREVPKIDERAWRQAVGFLRVAGSDDPLDATRVHPDYYPVAMAILEQIGLSVEELREEKGREQVGMKRGEVEFAELEKRFAVHYLLLKAICDELADPWPDPRDHEHGPILRRFRLTLNDLQAGQTMLGVVRKVVDFGAFVDVGAGEDGLVHISELSERFVRSPYDVVSVGELVKVRVVEADPEKGRIALSMRSPRAQRPPPRKAPMRPQRAHAAGRAQEAQAGAPRGAADASGRRPQSTLGAQSRRMQKAAAFRARSETGARVQSPPARQLDAKGSAEPGKGAARPRKVKELLKKLDIALIEKRGKPSE